MRRPRHDLIAFALIALTIIFPQPIQAQEPEQDEDSKKRPARPIIWKNPAKISGRDLRYGPGSPDLAPVAPFTFIEEDKSGESPKFVVRDDRGDVWTVKLGPEAQAETVATRLVWAVG